MKRVKHTSHGFTITEMVISVVVAGILTIVVFGITFYYYIDTAQAQTATDLALASQATLKTVTEDIRLADAISATNALSDPNAPSGGWTTSNPGHVIIIETPALDSSHNIIYDPDTGFPYRNEYIYFLSGTNMYKRVLANPSAPGNTAITSCPASKSGPTCPPDLLFSTHVSNLSFTFYDSSGNQTTDVTQTRSVDFEVDLAENSYGKNVTLNNGTRVTLRNE